MPYLGDALTSSLLFASLSFAVALGLVAAHSLWKPLSAAHSSTAMAAAAVVPVALLSAEAWLVLPPLVIGTSVFVLANRFMPSFSVPGRLLLLSQLGLFLAGSLWAIWFITSIPVSGVTRGLMLVGFPLLAITVMPGIVQFVEQWEVLCRERWTRPRLPLPQMLPTHHRKVSIHVPTYSEPPDVVIGTLDALARLTYSNFEVVVIDNNTRDPALWRPVEDHCRRLGTRFRFFHLESWPGAKAGALNFALTETAPDAELIAVIDADYHAERDFLSALVGYFDDPHMGFVQTPHDYRGWESSTYLRMCYWEYQYFFRTNMVSRNERDAALTVGTMCIIRRTALEDAGGWAEWCVTEDSELSVRIHALGYTSVYIQTTFGRGLIPDEFEGYKKQRFRWTYGPVQTLKHHLPLFFRRRAPRAAFSLGQWLHHVNHGLDRAIIGLQLLLLPLGLALITSIVIHGETIPVPIVLWIAATVGLGSTFASTWLIYRAVMGCSLRETLGALIATKSLSHTVAMASLWAIVTRSIPWRRTSKFKPSSLGLRTFRSARTELVLGVLSLGTAVGLFVVLRPSGFVVLLLLGALLRSLDYFAAPVAALMSEWHVQSGERQVERERVSVAEMA